MLLSRDMDSFLTASGTGENTGYDSSEVECCGWVIIISDPGGDSKEIRWGSKYPSNDTVRMADIGDGAFAI